MSETPQFGTAEYQQQSGINKCKTCDQTITGPYYRVSRAVTCPTCAERIANQLQPDTSGAFARAVLFGVGGAVLGFILYSLVGIVTGLEIGYASLAVGYFVGRAMMAGSAGIGGKRYQIAALILTYAAVSLSAVPIGLSQLSKQRKEQPSQTQTESKTSSEQNEVQSTNPPSLLAAVVVLAGVGLASPILNLSEPLNGLIGLVILFVGMRIAWRMAAGTKIAIMGPFKL
jgi:hypothetical protein